MPINFRSKFAIASFKKPLICIRPFRKCEAKDLSFFFFNIEAIETRMCFRDACEWEFTHSNYRPCECVCECNVQISESDDGNTANAKNTKSKMQNKNTVINDNDDCLTVNAHGRRLIVDCRHNCLVCKQNDIKPRLAITLTVHFLLISSLNHDATDRKSIEAQSEKEMPRQW